MSRFIDQITNCQTDLERVRGRSLEHVSTPETKLALLDLAWSHIKDWLPSGNMPAVGERGGSSSPVESEDRLEAMKVSRQAMRDDKRMKELCATLERTGAELFALVVRNVGLVDASKLPVADPDCQSCLRTASKKGEKIGGHHAPIRTTAEKHALCDPCYRHALGSANEHDRKITREDWPPVEYCHILHTQSATAAGRWLAREKRTAA